MYISLSVNDIWQTKQMCSLDYIRLTQSTKDSKAQSNVHRINTIYRTKRYTVHIQVITIVRLCMS